MDSFHGGNFPFQSLFVRFRGGVLGCPGTGSLGSMVIGSMGYDSPTYKWGIFIGVK